MVANSCLSNMHDPCDWRVENVGTRIDDPFLSGGDEGIFRVVFYGISVSRGVVRGADGIWKRRWAGVWGQRCGFGLDRSGIGFGRM